MLATSTNWPTKSQVRVRDLCSSEILRFDLFIFWKLFYKLRYFEFETIVRSSFGLPVQRCLNISGTDQNEADA